jgi:hypothetical protein
MNATPASTTTDDRARLAALTTFVAALMMGTVACVASEAGGENRAFNPNETGYLASGWGPHVGDPLSPDGSQRWGRPGYCPGSACVRTPGALLPAELRVP